jgi:hypothetical protein
MTVEAHVVFPAPSPQERIVLTGLYTVSSKQGWVWTNRSEWRSVAEFIAKI